MKEELPLTSNLDEITLPKLLKGNAARFGAARTALREKSRGIWQTCSWQEYYENVKYLSLGMISLGLAKGDKVAVMGNNRPASLYAELAAQAAGAISVGLYQDATVTEVAAVLKKCEVSFIVAEDQEQVDKVLEIWGDSPATPCLIYCDGRGMRNYRHSRMVLCKDVHARGRELGDQQPGLFDERLEEGRGDDIAIISTTSGTTGEPRGAMLSHRNILSMAMSLNQIDERRPSDEFVSYLPLAWFGEQMMAVASSLAVGFTVNFPERPETVLSDLREIGPHVMFSPPTVWESIAATVQVKIMDTTPFKRFMYNTCMGVGQRVAGMKLSGQSVPLTWQFLNGLAYIGLFRALRDRLGLSRVRSALTGGSALGSDVFTFFHAIGVNLKQVYGLTELSGVATMHRDGEVKRDTVGVPLPGTEISIAPDGEILARSSGVFQGYYKDEEATREVLANGWLRTGDAGHLDSSGHLVVLDRVKDLLTMADGSTFAPQFAESKLKFSPYIKEALVAKSANNGLLALICIDGRVVGKWAGDNKINYTTYSDLAGKSEISELINRELATINQSFPPGAKIRRFTLLFKELDADEGELTRTGKLRRAVTMESYQEVLDAMAAGKDELAIDKTIELQDGKSARIQTTLRIRNLD
jgi:long-chain acyl-CoA synthetase